MTTLNKPWSRRVLLVGAMLGALALAGCAGLRTVSTEVSTFGEWPSGRTPGSYAFKRLPSQQARAAETEMLEASARAALDKAGFKPAAGGQDADLLVQVGAREARLAASPWHDAMWWRGGFGHWQRGPWLAPRWGLRGNFGGTYRSDFSRYEREVALLIRDRASGKPLFEAYASSDGSTRADGGLFTALFEAALADFPRLGLNPRRVVVTLPPG